MFKYKKFNVAWTTCGFLFTLWFVFVMPPSHDWDENNVTFVAFMLLVSASGIAVTLYDLLFEYHGWQRNHTVWRNAKAWHTTMFNEDAQEPQLITVHHTGFGNWLMQVYGEDVWGCTEVMFSATVDSRNYAMWVGEYCVKYNRMPLIVSLSNNK
jgi:hypothetical protein